MRLLGWGVVGASNARAVQRRDAYLEETMHRIDDAIGRQAYAGSDERCCGSRQHFFTMAVAIYK